jgi:putative ABC transport system substrate-binding protein
VGFVSPQSPSTSLRGVTALWDGLRELGWIKGENLFVEERWADGQYDKLPALVAELIGRKIDVLVTMTTPAAIAARNATSTVPIVVTMVADPMRSRLVASLARPGSNLTGLSVGWNEGAAGKWLELLQEAVPRLSHVAVIEDLGVPIDQDLAKELEESAPTRGLQLVPIEVHGPGSLDRVFKQAARKSQAVLLLPGPVLASNRRQIAALAAKHRLPAMYFVRDFVDAGGLMAYAPDTAVMFRRAADYVDKILRGAKPGDLPIEQPTKFELVVNLKAANALGITIPESILLRADEVIR